MTICIYSGAKSGDSRGVEGQERVNNSIDPDFSLDRRIYFLREVTLGPFVADNASR
jgi:hypothetical protein